MVCGARAERGNGRSAAFRQGDETLAVAVTAGDATVRSRRAAVRAARTLQKSPNGPPGPTPNGPDRTHARASGPKNWRRLLKRVERHSTPRDGKKNGRRLLRAKGSGAA